MTPTIHLRAGRLAAALLAFLLLALAASSTIAHAAVAPSAISAWGLDDNGQPDRADFIRTHDPAALKDALAVFRVLEGNKP